MAKLAVLDKAGKKVSDIELNDGIFAIEPNMSAMHLMVVSYLAAQRQGTQCTPGLNKSSAVDTRRYRTRPEAP